VNNIETSIISDDKIYNQANYMSKIPFKINKKVLDFIENNGHKFNIILKGLHEKTDSMNLSQKEKQEITSHNSYYFHERNILAIAKLYENVDKIYFPLFLD